MHLRASRLAGGILGGCVATPLLLGLFLGAGAAAQDTTTTTLPATTTTAPTTTTTLPATTTTAPTTTTTLPATTTTHARPTTTTSHPTTTTTTAATTSSSSKVWGWILLVAAIALAAVLVGSLIARNRRQARAADWRHTVQPAVTAAELARELVTSLTPADDPQRRADVNAQVDEAVAALERAAASAPDDAAAPSAPGVGSACGAWRSRWKPTTSCVPAVGIRPGTSWPPPMPPGGAGQPSWMWRCGT